MFFSPEILTSRSNGLSTIWLMATLGNRPSVASAKLSRKDIMATEIPGVCRMITNPDGPLALRLSSNLLYGVSLVYQRQISYLLTEVSHIRFKISVENVLNLITLDPKMAKAKKSSLLLRNDLNSLNIDHVLLPLDPFPALAPTHEDYDDDLTLHSINNRLQTVAEQEDSENPDFRAVHTNLLIDEDDAAPALDLGFGFGEDGELHFYHDAVPRGRRSPNSSQSTLNGHILDINDQDDLVDGAEFMARAPIRASSLSAVADSYPNDYDGGGAGDDPDLPNSQNQDPIDYNNLPNLDDMFPPLQVSNPNATANPENDSTSTLLTQTQNARLDAHIASIINAHNNSSSPLFERPIASTLNNQPPAPARRSQLLRKCPYDNEIGLSSDALRGFRENYVSKMTALNAAKRRKLETRLNQQISVQSILQKSVGLHPFGKFLASFPLENAYPPSLETGRAGGPLASSRQPSLDIEIGRGRASTPRNFSLGISPQPVQIGSNNSSSHNHNNNYRSLSNGPFDIPSPLPRQLSHLPGVAYNLDDIAEDEVDGAEVMQRAYQRLKDQREGRAPVPPSPQPDQAHHQQWDYDNDYDAHNSSIIHHRVNSNKNIDLDLDLDLNLNEDLGLNVVLDNYYESSSGEDSSLDGEGEGVRDMMARSHDRQGTTGAQIKKNRYNNERHFFNYTRRMASKISSRQLPRFPSSRSQKPLPARTPSRSPSPSLELGTGNASVVSSLPVHSGNISDKTPVSFDVLFPLGTTSRREAAGAFMMVLKLVTNGQMRVRQLENSSSMGRGPEGVSAPDASRSGIWLYI